MQIDCDIHPGTVSTAALLPYLPEHWRDMTVMRGIGDLHSANYPDTTPLTSRAQWRPAKGRPGASAGIVASQCLEPFGSDIGILNPLFPVQSFHQDDLAQAYAAALNDWTRAEFLDRDSRFRASIVVNLDNIANAVAEIERCALDKRFVQVLVLAGSGHLLGRRQYWPIYEACVRHGLTLGVHAGQEFRNPPTALGWPSYYLEDYVAHAQSFQYQITSLFCEGVFNRFPTLTIVMLESGWTWVPALLWRIAKYWGGLRFEVPWTDRSPEEIVRDQLRFSLTPIDGPDSDQLRRVVDHLGSDRVILFSTDYPHNQFDGVDVFPAAFDETLRNIIANDAPRAAYPRLGDLA